MAETKEKLAGLQALLDESVPNTWMGAWIKAPFRCDGYVCVTNGHFLVGIEDVDTEAPPVTDKTSIETIRGCLTAPLAHESFDVEHLKGWSLREKPPCNICHGSGKYKCDACGGKGKEECVCDCGHLAHYIQCGDCKGTGKVDCECHFAICASVHGKPVNVLLVHRAIKLFSGTYQIGQDANPEKALIFGGNGWRAAIKPMRSQPTETYELTPAEARG